MRLPPEKPSRRELAGIAGAMLLAGAAAREAGAQAPEQRDWLREARESKRQAAAELARVAVPMNVEPAFRFRA